MDLWEKLGWAICVVSVSIFIVAISLCLFMPHTFEGYYLDSGHIWGSYDWAPDSIAFDYTPEIWQSIVENNLHKEPTK